MTELPISPTQLGLVFLDVKATPPTPNSPAQRRKGWRPAKAIFAPRPRRKWCSWRPSWSLLVKGRWAKSVCWPLRGAINGRRVALPPGALEQATRSFFY